MKNLQNKLPKQKKFDKDERVYKSRTTNFPENSYLNPGKKPKYY